MQLRGGITDLYCHSEPPPTSGELCFIINFIGGTEGGGRIFTGERPPLASPLNRPCEYCQSKKIDTGKAYTAAATRQASKYGYMLWVPDEGRREDVQGRPVDKHSGKIYR